MKRTIISMVAVALLLIATQAFAVTMWEATSTITPASAGQDITRLTVTDNGTSFTFDMYLLGQPAPSDANTQYNVYIGSTPTLPNDPGSFINSNFYRVVISYTVLTGFISNLVDLSDPDNPVQKQIAMTPTFSGGTNKLEWVIDKTDIAAVPFFMGTTESNASIIDQTSVAATPIPAAVWLFASGILSLIGLKRKI